MNNGAHSSALDLLYKTDCLLKQLPDPYISKESPHKGLIRLTFGGHHSGTKIAEEESGSNPQVLQLLQEFVRQAGPGVDLSSPTAVGPDC